MLPTAEVRWFYQGVSPAEVLAWFQRGERQPERQPRRVDYYLHLVEDDSLGIKLREGRIEVKVRLQQQGIVRFHERVAGLVEHWRKWSFQLAQADDTLTGLLTPASSWIAVKKERQLYTVQLTAHKRIVTLSAEDNPAEGCNLELTSIEVGGKQWWSLGFEAFGDELTIGENLRLVAETILTDDSGPPALGAEHSYGYPKWLALGP